MLTEEDIQKISTLMDSKLKSQKKAIVSALTRKLNIVIQYFDHVTTNHEKRLKRVESHVNLPPFAN